MRITLLCNWQESLVKFFLDNDVPLAIVLSDYDANVLRPDPKILEKCVRVYRVSRFNSVEEVGAVAVDLAVRGLEVERVFGLTEFSQYGVGYLEQLVRPGARDPLSHVAVRDKRLMKTRMREAGIRVPRWSSITDPANHADVRAAVERLRFPIVVKPAAGFGTMSTAKVSSEEELFARLESYDFEELIIGRHLIAEEFVRGREFHVDSLWVRGADRYMAICAYQQPRLDSITHRVIADGPADGSLLLPEEDYPELYRDVADMHRRANEALGVHTSVTQMEIFQDDDGRLWFSELGTRMAGAWGPMLLTHRYGHDIWEIVGEGMAGLPATVRRTGPRYMGVVHLAPEHPGTVTRMPTDDELSAIDGVLGWQHMRKTGEQARFAHAADWYLFVVLGADTEAGYRELAARVAAELPIHTDATPVS